MRKKKATGGGTLVTIDEIKRLVGTMDDCNIDTAQIEEARHLALEEKHGGGICGEATLDAIREVARRLGAQRERLRILHRLAAQPWVKDGDTILYASIVFGRPS